MTINWHQRAVALDLDGRAFMDGARVWAADGRTFSSVSPIDGRVLTDVARCGGQDVDLAVAAARRAVNDGRWSGQSPKARKQVMVRFADLIETHRDELALMETLDMGKPIRYSLAVDVPAAANCIRWYGEAIDKVYDQIAPTSKDALALMTREPIGVVSAIVPWNYPMLMAAWKIGPALAAGNSVILKPSEKSPLTAMRLAELAQMAGLPDGVLNVVPGYGAEAGEPLSLHLDVDCIGFTGSTAIGKRIAENAGKSNLKRAWTELGGKSPFLILKDADIEAATKACANSIFFNQGESCNAPSRLIVDASIKDEVIACLKTLAPSFAPKDPLDPQSIMGAIVDQVQLSRVMGLIAQGQEEGASLVVGGDQVMQETGGYYVNPTIFSGVSSQMCIAREEIFGPVLSIMEAASLDEAVAIANDTDYGLAASVWTKNIDRAITVSRRIRAGTVHVNSYDEDDITVPFGGYKQSGNGRDKSLHALEKYTELKTTWIRIGDGA
ncbi:MAG: aldehyde dehydrogenase [Rhodocyclaceae bacterium]|nr:aldehyde dehydrogenase [Rhodocyclaceae bacterium]MCA3022385.1 aldehyde dehydrogenase [Rhodocyclaceae bacterium]MCA3028436.1 aldehyde dehydrogenase [Rhodocyclaceae bacterium]MCA3042386.1 aldehyde dehydrogenase [Rhodocyclaceae bacterium]MCA3052080.1 aldehyde dehydrogenase [Rhodocyclaceae bacterium]